MDKKGYKSINKAIKGYGETYLGATDGTFRNELEKDETVAFVDIETFYPAAILNGLHKANLLATQTNLANGTKNPQLQLVQSTGSGNGEATMTFLDVNTKGAPEMSTFMPRS